MNSRFDQIKIVVIGENFTLASVPLGRGSPEEAIVSFTRLLGMTGETYNFLMHRLSICL